MPELIGNVGALFVIVMWLALVALGFCLPLIAWSVTRNIRGIRVQLERIGDTLDRRDPPAAAAPGFVRASARESADDRASTARPGALGI